MTEAPSPEIYALMKWVVKILIGIIALILGRFLWDVLSGESRKRHQFCPKHEIMERESEKLELTIFARLNKFEDKMDSMRNDIGEIKIKIAAIEPHGLPLKKN